MSVDIRKGDLVKATRRDDPEVSMTGRVRGVRGDAISLPYQGSRSAYTDYWSFEVLDRPLPPIDEELLTGAVTAWRHGYGFSTPTKGYQVDNYRASLTAVINYLRQNDPILKENA